MLLLNAINLLQECSVALQIASIQISYCQQQLPATLITPTLIRTVSDSATREVKCFDNADVKYILNAYKKSF